MKIAEITELDMTDFHILILFELKCNKKEFKKLKEILKKWKSEKDTGKS